MQSQIKVQKYVHIKFIFILHTVCYYIRHITLPKYRLCNVSFILLKLLFLTYSAKLIFYIHTITWLIFPLIIMADFEFIHMI